MDEITKIIRRPPPCVIPDIGGLGDVDGDGWVSSLDITMLQSLLAEDTSPSPTLTKPQRQRAQVIANADTITEGHVEALRQYVAGEQDTFETATKYMQDQLPLFVSLDLDEYEVTSGGIISGTATVSLGKQASVVIANGSVHLASIDETGSYTSIDVGWFKDLAPGATYDIPLRGSVSDVGEIRVAAVVHGSGVQDIKTVTIVPVKERSDVGIFITPKRRSLMWGEPLDGMITVFNHKAAKHDAFGTVRLAYVDKQGNETPIDMYTFSDLRPGVCEVFTYATQVWDDRDEITLTATIDGNGHATTTERILFTIPKPKESPYTTRYGWVGDLSDDGMITVDDVKRSYLGLVERGVFLTENERKRLDINGNGDFDLEDCNLLVKYFQGNLNTLDESVVNTSEQMRRQDIRLVLLPQKRRFIRGDSAIFVARITNEIESNVAMMGTVSLGCRIEDGEREELASSDFEPISPGTSMDVAFAVELVDDEIREYYVALNGTSIYDSEVISFDAEDPQEYDMVDKVRINLGKDATIVSADVKRAGNMIRAYGKILLHRPVDVFVIDIVADDETVVWSGEVPVGKHSVGEMINFETDFVPIKEDIKGKLGIVLKKVNYPPL